MHCVKQRVHVSCQLLRSDTISDYHVLVLDTCEILDSAPRASSLSACPSEAACSPLTHHAEARGLASAAQITILHQAPNTRATMSWHTPPANSAE